MARSIFTATVMLLIAACGANAEQGIPDATALVSIPDTEASSTAPAGAANVEAVIVRGEAGSYSFSVVVRSVDTGCDQYSDWWEALSESGELVYRRVLLHSHVDEQPFTRTGGPVDVQPGDTIIVRAHMNTSGFGGSAMRGSVADGFSVVELPSGFGDGVETVEPLPTSCAF